MEVIPVLIIGLLSVGGIIYLATRKRKLPTYIPPQPTIPRPIEAKKTMSTANFTFGSPAADSKPTPRAKPKSETTYGTFQVTGYHYLSEDVQKMIWKELKVDDELTLIPYPNKFDSEAVRVKFRDTPIGWIPRDCRRKKEIFNALSEGREVKAVCIKNRRGQDTLRASRPDENGKWNDISRQAQFVEVKFTKDRD